MSFRGFSLPRGASKCSIIVSFPSNLIKRTKVALVWVTVNHRAGSVLVVAHFFLASKQPDQAAHVSVERKEFDLNQAAAGS